MRLPARILLLALAAAPVGFGLSRGAAPAPGAGAADPLRPRNSADAVAGTASCAACHNASDTGSASEGVPTAKDHPFATRYKSDEFVLLSEGRTWPRDDPHSLAYKGLSTELGKAMLARLPKGQDPAWVGANCLTCHAVDTLAGDTLPPDADKMHPATRFDTADGVSCAACHGVRREWQSAHYAELPDAKGDKAITWRAADPAKKTAAGMHDLRDPAVKANLCATCHVGSAELGRIVSHEAYAAGHPPLPPLELSGYLDGEPRHWAPTSDLPYFAKSELEPAKLWQTFHAQPAGAEVPAARELASGAVASLRAEALLLKAGTEGESLRDGLDFARFDCLACHHDLKIPSERQAPDAKRAHPGRPTLRPSIVALAEVVAAHSATVEAGGLSAKSAGFESKWEALRRAATGRPFGDPDSVRAAAGELAAWCDGVLEVQSRCDSAIYTAAQSERLRGMLAKAALDPSKNRDPEAAMVLAWGYLTLAKAGGAVPEARLAELGRVLPVSVRTKPAGRGAAPAPLDWVARQGRLNEYRAAAFATPFKALVGGE